MLSLLSAFGLPRRFTDLGGTAMQAVLIPVSRPTYKLANAIRGRFDSQPQRDTRESRQIEQENLALKYQVQQMTATIDQLRQQAGERASLGEFQSFCDRFEVTAADAPPREGITITGSGVSALQVDEPVLSSGSFISLIGRINRVGAAAAHVRLLTDIGSAVTAQFVTYSGQGAQATNLPALVKGAGLGMMVIDNLPMDQVTEAKLHVGDWLVLNDAYWPRELQNIRIGQVASIQPLARQPLFALITLAPEQQTAHLSDIWVMTHHR